MESTTPVTWQNLLDQHQSGNWHGFWTTYNSQKEANGHLFNVLEIYKQKKMGIRLNTKITIQYPDGKQETKTFGPFKDKTSETKALFLMQL